MLRGIRTASANWLGRIVMGVVLGLIAISFAIWGIGDIFRGFGRSSLARIGGTEITIEQFRQLYSERLQQLGRQLGRPITLDQARQMGIDQQLVGQLIGEATLDERVKALRLGISDEEIARRITEQSGTAGPTGQFDRTRFEMMLRNNQITERRFLAEQRRRLLRRQLAGTVLNGTTLPKAAIEAAERYQNEQRTARIRPARPGAGRRDPRADAGRAREVLRGAQGAVPRAGVSQDRRAAAVARRAGDVDRRSPMRTFSAPMRSAARAISRPSAGPFSRSSSAIRRRRRPPPNASPRANRSTTSPRSASSPKRTSISAR